MIKLFLILWVRKQVKSLKNMSFDLVIGDLSSVGSVDKEPEETLTIYSSIKNQLNTTANYLTRTPEMRNLWLSINSAVSDGQIAVMLDSKILVQLGRNMPEFRRELSRRVDITSIIDFSRVKETLSGSNNSNSISVMFARNKKPSPASVFRITRPHPDSLSSNGGVLRIDGLGANEVSNKKFINNPNILKTFLIGSLADQKIFEMISSDEHPTLKELVLSRKNNVADPIEKNIEKTSSIEMFTGEFIDVSPNIGFYHPFKTIAIEDRKFVEIKNERNKEREFSKLGGPNLIIGKRLQLFGSCVLVGISEGITNFSYSTYVGYSGEKFVSPYGLQLVKYLVLLLSSKITLWQILIKGGNLGVAKNEIEKTVIDGLLVPDFHNLSKKQRTFVDNLFEEVKRGAKSQSDIDKWLLGLYDFGNEDYEVIRNTVDNNLMARNGNSSITELVSSQKIMKFCKILESELTILTSFFNTKIDVEIFKEFKTLPWQIIVVNFGRDEESIPIDKKLIQELILSESDATPTKIVDDSENHRLLICSLSEDYYWSESYAQQIALKIFWNHSNILERT